MITVENLEAKVKKKKVSLRLIQKLFVASGSHSCPVALPPSLLNEPKGWLICVHS